MTRVLMIGICLFGITVAVSESRKPTYDFSDLEYHEPPIEDVRISYYEPVSEQCQGNPLITATNAKIDTLELRRGNVRWCAVSRDLEERFKMGDSIDVFISENHPWNGKYLVNDRTSRRLTKTVDILSNTFNGGCYKGTVQ